MTFDNEQHKSLVIEMIEKAAFPGAVLEIATALKAAAQAAKVQAQWTPEHEQETA